MFRSNAISFWITDLRFLKISNFGWAIAPLSEFFVIVADDASATQSPSGPFY